MCVAQFYARVVFNLMKVLWVGLFFVIPSSLSRVITSSPPLWFQGVTSDTEGAGGATPNKILPVKEGEGTSHLVKGAGHSK